MSNSINAAFIIEHARSKTKGRGPSLGFMGIKNPKKALEKATFFYNLIQNLIDSKPHKEKSEIRFREFKDEDFAKMSPFDNCFVRVKNLGGEFRYGQLDFYFVTENGKIIDANFFFENEKSMKDRDIEYDFKVRYGYRYDLGDLKNDVESICSYMQSVHREELVYIILDFPHFMETSVLWLSDFKRLSFSESHFSSIPAIEKIVDDISRDRIRDEKEQQKLHARRDAKIAELTKNGDRVFMCPSCGRISGSSSGHYCA